jgi:hypothetical protein
MGIGSKIKDRIRKIIPNEAAELAVKAAPFVAPFNPAIAAAMSGIGSFDKTGRIGSSLKSAGKTYVGGQVARGIAGAGPQWGFKSGTGNMFTSPFTGDALFGPKGSLTSTGEGSFFRGEGSRLGDLPPETSSNIKSSVDVATSPANTSAIEGGQSIMGPEGTIIDSTTNEVIAKGGEIVKTKMVENPTFADRVIKFLNMNEEGKAAQLVEMALSEKGMMVGRGIISAILTDMSNKDQPQFRSWEEIPTNMYNLEYKNARDGGIIGLANGGQPTMEMDYRGGGFIPVGARERADDVPARLSKNEFVMTADAVRAAGGGSVDVGAQRMYNLMNQLEGVA